MKLTAFIFLFIILDFSVLAQTRIIKGTIRDGINQPIKGVSVSGNGTEIAVFTDIKGFYKISLPDSIQEIVFSKVGFYTVTEKINDRNTINLTLIGLELVQLSLKDLLQVNISTVSLNEQKVIEAPGVASIITQEELRLLGIRTIREALTLVPGFAPLQNDDEQILAVRGIFATTNQKILVMRDGHSLNEANVDLPQTDYSLSIENIKKIEIIRGPGASIYGNSALAAVVNIITTDTEGSRVKFGIGNFGQYNLDAVSCIKTKEDGYFMFFGRFAGTSGQPYDVEIQKGKDNYFRGTYNTNHYPTNYDLGFRYKNNLMASNFSVRLHNYKTYWSAQGFYTNVDSLLAKPGLKQESFHYDLSLDPRINENIHLHLQHYVDYCKLYNTRLIASIDDSLYLKGYVQLNEWNALKTGLNYYSTWQYSANGQLVGGIFLEQRRYLDSWVASNASTPSAITYLKTPFFKRGMELRAAGFLQIQQPLSTWLKLDIGARYDWAENYNASFNPRIALIANFINQLTFKAIFTRAFQAPGYSYRTSNASYSGSIGTLNPEKLTTYQTSIRYEFDRTSFFELTAFYNQLSNLITRPPEKKYYANIGNYASYGLEAEGQYNKREYSVFMNYSFLLPDTSYMDDNFKMANVHNGEFKHFPMHTVNAGIIYHFIEKIHLSLSAQYASSFYTIFDKIVDQRLLFNTTLTVQDIFKYFELQASIYNLTNKKYKLGDPSVMPMEQPGRWFMFSVVYSFGSRN
jgi:outer membrane receptor for ferrienterochelin and colicins